MKKILSLLGWRTLFVLMAGISVHVPAQNGSALTPAKYQSLKIGDVVPDYVWNLSLEMTNPPDLKTLREEKDKLLILAFWGTGCPTAVNSMAGIQPLQEKFRDRLKIVPVTNQDKEALQKFFISKKAERIGGIQTVGSDKMLEQLFYHIGVPFLVWIKDGRVMNTTDIAQLTEKTVSDILEGRPSTLQSVVHEDPKKTLFLSDNFKDYSDAEIIGRSMLIKGFINGFGQGKGGALRQDGDGRVTGRLLTNRTLADIYFSIGMEMFRKKNEGTLFNAKRIFYNLRDLRNISPPEEETEFYRKNIYSYEINIPSKISDSLYHFMIDELSRYTPYKIEFKKKEVECLVLKRTSKNDKVVSKGGKMVLKFNEGGYEIRNASLSGMINMWNAPNHVDLPIVDETGIEENVDMHIPPFSDVSALQSSLNKYDLKIVRAKRKLMMMVVSDNN